MNLGREIKSMELEPVDATPAPAEFEMPRIEYRAPLPETPSLRTQQALDSLPPEKREPLFDPALAER